MIEIKYRYNFLKQKVFYILQNGMCLSFRFFYGFYNFSEIRNINVDEAEWTPLQNLGKISVMIT